jgi:hypothetical protein
VNHGSKNTIIESFIQKFYSPLKRSKQSENLTWTSWFSSKFLVWCTCLKQPTCVKVVLNQLESALIQTEGVKTSPELSKLNKFAFII